MFIRKTRLSKYTLRIPSARVTPTNSLSDTEWDNDTLYKNRKTNLRHSSKKRRYGFVAITGGLAIAILIVIAVVVPSINNSKSTTTKSTVPVSSVTTLTSMLVSPTNSITNTLSVTDTTTTTTTFVTTTTTTTIIISTFSSAITNTSGTTTIITTSTFSSAITNTSGATTTSTSASTTTSETTSTFSSAIMNTSGATTTSTSASTTTSETTSTSTSTTTSTITTYTSTSTTTSETISTTTTYTSTSTTTSETTTTTTTYTSTSTTTSETTSTSTTTSETTSTTTTSETTTSTSTTTTSGPLRWNTTATTVAGQLTSSAATPIYLNFPIGIFIDSSDTLYVSDARNNRIEQFLSGSTTGRTVAGQSNGAVGTTASFLNLPSDVAADSNGNVYAADSNNNRIQLWSVNASSAVTVAGSGTTAGNSTTQLDSPRGIAYDSNTDTFYVSDGNNNRIMRYTLNSTVGTIVAGGNGAGISNTQLYNPRGLYFDSSTNSLVIVNTGIHNVVRWVIGASNWTLVAGNFNASATNINATAGSGPAALNGPFDATLDPMGNVYVADRYNHRIQFFQAGQTNGTTIAGITGVAGSTATTLNQPLSVALDSQLNLYVADSLNNRIQKFTRY